MSPQDHITTWTLHRRDQCLEQFPLAERQRDRQVIAERKAAHIKYLKQQESAK